MSSDEEIAKLDFELFQNFSEDFVNAYKENTFQLYFSGPRVGCHLEEKIAKLFMNKFKIDRETFTLLLGSILKCMHYVLMDEVEIVKRKFLKDKKDEFVELFDEKINFVKKILEKVPDIEQGYLSYTHSISDFFYGIKWEISLKPSNFISIKKDKIKTFVNAMVKIQSTNIASREDKEETKSIEFVISKNDINFLIKSLQNIREELLTIEKNFSEG